MQISIALALWLTALAVHAAPHVAEPKPPSDSSVEAKYLTAKERISAQIGKVGAPGSDAVISAMYDAQDQLISILQPILPPPPIKDLDARVIMPIDDFEPGTPGAGQADGLIFGANDLTVFETTDHLFSRYIARHAKDIDNRKPQQSEQLYSNIFDWDTHFDLFDELPVKASSPNITAHAYVGMWAQDTGPWNPQNVILFIRQQGRVYVANLKLQDPAPPIPACNTIYSVSAHDTAQDKDAEAKQFQQYQQCWRSHARALTFYKDAQKIAQDLVTQMTAR
jgi:hypothetical protein